MEKILFENTKNSRLVSDILEKLSETAKGLPGVLEVIPSSETMQGEKGVLLTSVAIGIGTGLAANLITELVKNAVSRAATRQDFDPKMTIRIQERDIELEVILGNGEIIINTNRKG